ncbi:alpha/beta fold hydrolase [Paraglaciecola sp. 2405UD69-4]|uniref:alpha/beta fold hydrolase n=1 Tax=Paraglaciecola sp. 2405UD69-4 TaxID=3391836 RepID=UPI0039C966BC
MSQFRLCNEKNLMAKYHSDIQSFWRETITISSLAGKDEVPIAYAYAIHPNAVGSIVISSGRIESFIKYKEVIYDFYQNGYSVFIHDHRGQGMSGRLLKNTHMGYVEDFEDYVSDFKTFMDTVVLKRSQHKAHLVCHSMGSAIGALLVLRYPGLFQKVVFSAPMFGIRPSLPNWLSQALLSLNSFIYKEVRFFWGQKAYISKPFEKNELTHSDIRYAIFRQEYENQPELQLGGVTGSWLKAALIAMDKIEREAATFNVPALVIQAGGDSVVDNKRQLKVAKKIPHSEIMRVENAKHELFAESDKYRVPTMTRILTFFK